MNRNEAKETTLVLTDEEIFVKQRRAIRNTGMNTIIGETFSIDLPIKKAVVRDKCGELKTAIIHNDLTSTTIEYSYRKPLKPGEVHASELSMLIDEIIVKKLGDLKIIDWGKENISDIHFLNTKPFFISAIGNSKIVGKRVVIEPLKNYKSIVSHAKKDKTIRIEYFNKNASIPEIIWRERYTLKNISPQNATNIEIKFISPRNDTNQEVTIRTSNNVVLNQDSDGNTWSNYSIDILRTGESSEIIIEYLIKRKPYSLYSDYGTLDFIKSVTEPGSVGTLFLSNTILWPVKDPSIVRIANLILEGQKDIYNIIRLIFEFVNQSFTYKVNEQRFSALEILRTKEGDCSEFSDLFVTLARACGIPARVCTGYIWHTDGKLEGHAWTEFFSKQGWITMDPLWGYLHGTSFQHILFTKEGKEVDNPFYMYKSYGGEIKVDRKYDIRIA